MGIKSSQWHGLDGLELFSRSVLSCCLTYSYQCCHCLVARAHPTGGSANRDGCPESGKAGQYEPVYTPHCSRSGQVSSQVVANAIHSCMSMADLLQSPSIKPGHKGSCCCRSLLRLLILRRSGDRLLTDGGMTSSDGTSDSTFPIQASPEMRAQAC